MDRPDVVTQKEFDQVILESLGFVIDPYLIIAIGLHETGWGAKGWGKHGYVLGYGCFDATHSDKRFKGFHQQIVSASAAISEFIGFRVTQMKLENFAKYVWKPGDPALWAAGVWRWYTRLINTHAPEIPICQAPPAWAVPALVRLYNLHIINTPFGDLDFYRTVQVVANLLSLLTNGEAGVKYAKG